jgi:competence protein ComEC
MQNRKIIYTLLFCLIFLGVLFFYISASKKDQTLRVVFLNVGQGDAILISSGSDQILIDGGKDGKLLLEELGKYVPFWDRSIETVIETHPDADHIGGLIDLFETYKVENVLKTHMPADSQTYRKLEEEIVANGSKIIEAEKGDVIKFPNGAEADILYPFNSILGTTEKNTNVESVTMKLTFGKNTFLFAGDLPSEKEKELIASGVDLQADFLKISHHGSKYSSSDEFLEAVKPKDAIISVGRNNNYGHPNQEALQRLLSHGINIFRTDQGGDIEYICPNIESLCFKSN